MNRSREAEARALWKQCFGDSDAYLDLFFSKLGGDDTTFLYNAGGKAVGHLQLLDVAFASRAHLYPANYVFAACTHPDYRGRGVMKELLHEALRKGRERGDICSFIIPAEEWLYDYYARVAGYAEIIGGSRTQDERVALDEENLECTAPTLIDYLCEVEQTGKETRLVHTKPFLEAVVVDFETGHDRFVWEHRDGDGLVSGAVLVIEREDGLYVDTLFGAREARQALLKRLKERAKDKPITYDLNPQSSQEQYTRGMIRILDLPAFLRSLALQYPKLCMSVAFHDDLFPENSGVYEVIEGTVMIKPLTKDTSNVLYSMRQLFSTLSCTHSLPFSCRLSLLFDR